MRALSHRGFGGETGWVFPDQILPTAWELVSVCQKGFPMTAIIESRMPLSGGDLAFTVAGTAPAVLLLVHGLGGSRQTWRHLIPALARTHTVIAPDLPGHGESDPPAGTIHWVRMPVACAICCSPSDIGGPHWWDTVWVAGWRCRPPTNSLSALIASS